MIPDLIEKLLAGDTVEPERLEQALHRIMLGDADEAQTAGLLVALRIQEPGARTLAACARAMRAHRIAVHAEVRPLIDTCGTGGDRAGTFNISTAAAFVVAAAGGAVAKHGNRSVSSQAGSADVLEACGCALDVGPQGARTLLDATGFAFLYAPAFHPAMANVAPVRRSLGIRTIFNLLGPLANPALAECQLLGVYDPSLTEAVAEALRELGTKSALVIHCQGLDEIGVHAVTQGHLVRDGRVEPYTVSPDQLGLRPVPVDVLRGGNAPENAAILRSVLGGEPGPRADVVALNAAAALFVSDLAPSFTEALNVGRETLRSGRALRVLERYAESSQRVSAKGELR